MTTSNAQEQDPMSYPSVNETLTFWPVPTWEKVGLNVELAFRPLAFVGLKRVPDGVPLKVQVNPESVSESASAAVAVKLRVALYAIAAGAAPGVWELHVGARFFVTVQVRVVGVVTPLFSVSVSVFVAGAAFREEERTEISAPDPAADPFKVQVAAQLESLGIPPKEVEVDPAAATL